jgi:hypothetical protein
LKLHTTSSKSRQHGDPSPDYFRLAGGTIPQPQVYHQLTVVIGEVPHRCSRSREPVWTPVGSGVRLQQVVGIGVCDDPVDHGEGIAKICQNIGFRLGRIGTAEVASGGRLFGGHLLRPCLVAARYMFHLPAKCAYILEFAWVGLEFHLSSGTASARATKSRSMSFQMKLTESAMVLRCGSFFATAPNELIGSTPMINAR